MLPYLGDLEYLRIPYDDIEAATNNFDERNIIEKYQTTKRKGIILDKSDLYSYNRVYRGELIWYGNRMNVIVEESGMAEDRLVREVLMTFRYKHKNIATFVGFGYKECKGSYLVSECDYIGVGLGQILNISPVPGSSNRVEYVYKNLTCSRRLQICLGAARALSHIHDKKCVHSTFSSDKILLDKDLEAKVVGFFMIPPLPVPHKEEIASNFTRIVTQESNVYSFGVVLIDMFCQQYGESLQWMYNQAVPRIKYTEFDENIRKQINSKSLTILSNTLNQCLNDKRVERPNMAKIVKQLEEALILQWKHENPKIGLDDIKLATKNFDETYLIGSGAYGKVYKAQLNLFDQNFLLGIKQNNQKEIPKKHNLFYKGLFLGKEKENLDEIPIMKIPKELKTVAIKRILNDEKGHGRQGFHLEIEMLRKCDHPNIVSLHGYCDDDSELILVYEFVSNGSLDDYLGSTKKETYLPWVQRIKICLDIAYGLDYLHTELTDKERMIHRDVKSANILLGNNLEAKIADFGLSKFYSVNQLGSTIMTYNIAGTDPYLDPEYLQTGKLKKQSDIYSFGVVLFEILSGTLAYQKIYTDENIKGLAAVVRRRFSEGTLKEVVDPKVMEEAEELCFGLKIGANQKSLEAFSKIAFKCLAETQDERPTMEDIIKELEIALKLQEMRKDIHKFSLEDIKLGTKNFSDENFIRKERFGKLYRGEVPYDDERKIVILKVGMEEHNFLRELEILFGHKHKNIIDVVGYCNEKDEKIIVYENEYNGSTLNSHLNDVRITWTKRLEICISIANGLKFLHTGFASQTVVHGDIKSSNIVLNGDWVPKISCFESSLISPKNQEMEYVVNDLVSSNYIDPVYKEHDIYSFGVILFEMLCGRPDVIRESNQFRDFLVDENVFEGIKEQIEAKSLATFRRIACQCLHEEREKRPKADEVYMQLKKSLDIQVLKDRLVVKKDLHLLKLEEGGNLSNHIVTFSRLVSKLSSINEIMKEEDLALFMLFSLPKSYSRFVDNMLTGATSLKLKDVLQKLGDNKINEGS